MTEPSGTFRKPNTQQKEQERRRANRCDHRSPVRWVAPRPQDRKIDGGTKQQSDQLQGNGRHHHPATGVLGRRLGHVGGGRLSAASYLGGSRRAVVVSPMFDSSSRTLLLAFRGMELAKQTDAANDRGKNLDQTRRSGHPCRRDFRRGLVGCRARPDNNVHLVDNTFSSPILLIVSPT
jgi:hypothetical protein